MRLLSFVVIAYNEEACVARTIASITGLEGLGDYEVIVVDDGSGDRTCDEVSGLVSDNPRIRLIMLETNRGRGYARRRGVNEARGNWIATVDADIILPSHWLNHAFTALGEFDAVSGTAIPDGDAAYIYSRLHLSPRLVGHSISVTGSNALYRRRVFDLLNFDQALREGEDVALNYAASSYGLKFGTIPGLTVRHEEDKSFGTCLKWLFQTGRGATRQLLMYHQVRQPDLVFGAFLTAGAVGLAQVVEGNPIVAFGVPGGFLLIASLAHLRSRFDLRSSAGSKVAFAVLIDSALLAAYFLGRVAGFLRR